MCSPPFEPTCSFRTPSSAADGRDPADAQERSPPAAGGTERVLVPGEIELANEAHNRAHGILARGTDCGAARSPRRAAGRAVSGSSCVVIRTGVCARMTARRCPDLQFPADSDRRAFRLRQSPLAAGSRARPRRPEGLRRHRPGHARRRDRRPGDRQSRSQAAIAFGVYDNVTADSGSTLIGEAVDALKASGADVVVGLGGGSALDTGEGGGGARDQPRLAARLCRPAQGQDPAAADDRDADDRRHRQRSQLVVGVHRRRARS